MEYQDIHISLKYVEVKVHQVRQQIGTPPQRIGESEFVVLLVCNGLVIGKHKVLFDNLFSSLELMKYLLSKGIYGVARFVLIEVAIVQY